MGDFYFVPLNPPQGDEFVYHETWGEQLMERVHPIICILDVESNSISLLENIPENISPGQVTLVCCL